MTNYSWKDAFRAEYKPLLKDKYDEFEEALTHQKNRHIRLNSSRNIDYLKELSNYADFIPLNEYKNVYQVVFEKENIVNSLSFQTGGVYIMNPSSVVPAEILSSFMPENPIILDVSSAPGGKTCAISDFINRKGVIIANELSSSRLKSLHFNLEKYGCYNVKTTSYDGRILNKFFKNTFDGILLDAPCSNENKIFRDKTVQNVWNKDLVLKMATLQSQLIESAFDCLKDGGYLVYSTCTLSIEENELVVKKLLDKYSNAELIKVDGYNGNGLSKYDDINEKVIRIMPTKTSIDGFFTAVIKKQGQLKENIFAKNKLSSKQSDFFKNYLGSVVDDINIIEAENRGYMERGGLLFPKIPFKRRGLNIYRIAGNNYEPSSQFIWEYSSKILDNHKTYIDKNNAENYMKGFDLNYLKGYKGNALFYDNIGIGFGKIVNNQIKNKLDRYFLYGKNIEW